MSEIGDLPEDSIEAKEAIEFLNSGKLYLSYHLLVRLCKKHPEVAKFHFNTALVLFKLNKFEEALKKIDDGLRIVPDDQKALKFKADIEARLYEEQPSVPVRLGLVNKHLGISGPVSEMMESEESVGHPLSLIQMVKPATEPEIEPVSEELIEPVIEPVADEIAEPVIEPVAEGMAEPVMGPVLEPATEEIAEPVFDPAAEEIAEPILEPVAEEAVASSIEPVAEEMAEPVEKPATEEIVALLPASFTEEALAPAIEPVVEEMVEPVAEPVAEPAEGKFPSDSGNQPEAAITAGEVEPVVVAGDELGSLLDEPKVIEDLDSEPVILEETPPPAVLVDTGISMTIEPTVEPAIMDRLTTLMSLVNEACEEENESQEPCTAEHDFLPGTYEISVISEESLVTFQTFRALESYKETIHNLVAKYLDMKLEQESASNIPGVGTSGSEQVNLLNKLDHGEILGRFVPFLENDDVYPSSVDLSSDFREKARKELEITLSVPITVPGPIREQMVTMQAYVDLVRTNRNPGSQPSRELVNDAGTSQFAPTFVPYEPVVVESPIDAMKASTIATAPEPEEEKVLEDTEPAIILPETGAPEIFMSEEKIAEMRASIAEIGKKIDLGEISETDAAIMEVREQYKAIARHLYTGVHYVDAISLYKSYVEVFTEDIEALFNLGFCYREINELSEAEAMFKRILELFYDNAYCWFNLAVIYELTNDGPKELYCLQKARDFGYDVDVMRLSRLAVAFVPKNPFEL
jgi:tetratricopeptide (TPR) repeat protein